MIKQNYPDYELVATHISHDGDMKMVTFQVDQMTHSLVLAFPAFIKDYKTPHLSLYEIETVPVTIEDKNRPTNSYSQVKIQKHYITAEKRLVQPAVNDRDDDM